MTDILARPEPQTDAEDEAALAAIWEEIAHIRHIMDVDQAEIERLQAESRQIKAESRTIMAETRAIIASLKAMEF